MLVFVTCTLSRRFVVTSQISFSIVNLTKQHRISVAGSVGVTPGNSEENHTNIAMHTDMQDRDF